MRPSIKRAKGASERGAAVVEMAVMMLVIVPVVLYTFFLSDVLYLRLESQEAALASVWDFAFRDYETEGAYTHATHVQVANRAEYGDHTSSYSDPFNLFNSWGAGAHVTPFADLVWPNNSECGLNCAGESNPSDAGGGLTQKKDAFGNVTATNDYSDRTMGTQITCRPVDTAAGINPNPPVDKLDYGSSDFARGKGGLLRCFAKGVVYNYLIGSFITTRGNGWESTKLIKYDKTDQGQAESSISNVNYQQNFVVRDQGGLLVDSWGIVHAASANSSPTAWGPQENFAVSPAVSGAGQAFPDRVAYVYTKLSTYNEAVAKADDYFSRAKNKDVAVNAIVTVNPGDMPPAMDPSGVLPSPLALFMANAHDNPGSENLNSYKRDGFFTRPMDNQGPLNQQGAYNARQNFYLGCPPEKGINGCQ